MIIDAKDSILGRVAVVAAKKALLGETVNIVNCEHVLITGKKANTIAEYKHRIFVRGTPRKGPHITKQSDRLVRRTVRGMLPFKKTRGREAFKRVMCYIGVPDKFANQKLEKLALADISKLTVLRYIYLKDLVKELGGKI